MNRGGSGAVRTVMNILPGTTSPRSQACLYSSKFLGNSFLNWSAIPRPIAPTQFTALTSASASLRRRSPEVNRIIRVAHSSDLPIVLDPRDRRACLPGGRRSELPKGRDQRQKDARLIRSVSQELSDELAAEFTLIRDGREFKSGRANSITSSRTGFLRTADQERIRHADIRRWTI